MISFKKINSISAGLTILSDDILEYHASRILMLILKCGTGDRKRKVPRIIGLTRLAKLDFFVRYPEHFEKAAKYLGEDVETVLGNNESKMIRHHYGPWDERYYQVLSYLESKDLINVIQKKNRYEFYLTEKGKNIAKKMSQDEPNKALIQEMDLVNTVFKNYSGNQLKNLIISNIERVTRYGEVEVLPFEKKVNLLIGDPHSGKTIWLQMLDYLLGDSDSPEETFGAENEDGIPITEKYESASADILIGNEEHRIERRWQEYGMKTKVLVDGEEILESEFSDWIFDKLDISKLHFPKGNPYKEQSWPKLSFRNLLRHVYRQEVYWSDIADRQPKSDQFATLSLILGFAHKLFPDEFGELVELNKRKMRYEVERDESKELLDNFVRKMSPAHENITVATEGAIVDKINSLKEDLGEIENKREEIISNGFKSIEGVDESKIDGYENLLNEKINFQEQYEETLEKIEKIQDRRKKLSNVSSKVSSEINKLQRVQSSGSRLSDLKVTHCPACDQEVKDDVVSDDICFLCHEPISSDETDGDSERLEFEISQLQSESEELDEMIDSIDKDLTDLKHRKRAIKENLKDIKQQIEPLQSKVSSLVNNELSNLDSKKGQLREKIENFQRLLDNVIEKEDVQSKIDELDEKINTLKVEIDELSADISFEAISNDLEEGMNEYINRLNKEKNIWSHSRINFDIGKNGFNFFVGERKWTSLSNNHIAYFLFAYHYGLMYLSDKEGYNYPGLLIIDFPLELAVGDEVKGSENYLIEPFVELSDSLDSDHQIIFAGRTFNLKGTNNIYLDTQWD